MVKYCPIRKEKVIYLECQECEYRLQCHSLQQPEEMEHPPQHEEIKQILSKIDKNTGDFAPER